MVDLLFPTTDDIADAMRRIRGTRIGVLGDFCLDAYFEIDSGVEELSIETGKRVQHVRRQRYSPGGGGNVVVNLCALEIQSITVYGVVGDDMFGRELQRMFDVLGVNTSSLLVQQVGFDTPVYGKPLLGGVEQQRLDFGTFNLVSDNTWIELYSRIAHAHSQLDFLLINQQLPCGWCNDERASQLRHLLIDKWPGKHLVDTRDHLRAFQGVALKLNQHEAGRLLIDVLSPAIGQDQYNDSEILRLGKHLSRTASEVQFITRGDRGIAVCLADDVEIIPGVQISGPTDPVGAGDTATAMLGACRAAQLDAKESAVLANLAASITVSKINQTGTATESELRDAIRTLEYNYNPTLANEPRFAKHVTDTDIELVESAKTINLLKSSNIRFAVFDHDGTISTLRQGWETIMEPVMLQAILGKQFHTANTVLFNGIRDRVRRFIEQSTGIQTITQMDGLVNLVDEYAIIPATERLDAWGYKQVYNDALMGMVNERIKRLQKAELEVSDFIMKGAVSFLHALRERDTTLFLVSGTDESDTRREAALLGYADMFDGGIFGALPGSRSDMKSEIIQDVIQRITPHSAITSVAPSGFLVIGDGPVEIRLGRRNSGLTLGLASNEERRFGINQTKRRRLIHSGAHLIAPDFSQWRQLVDWLFDQATS